MIFVACNMQQNQTDFILLHVACNKTHCQKVAKQNYFAIGNAETFSMQFVKNMFLLQSHKKLSRVPEAS